MNMGWRGWPGVWALFIRIALMAVLIGGAAARSMGQDGGWQDPGTPRFSLAPHDFVAQVIPTPDGGAYLVVYANLRQLSSWLSLDRRLPSHLDGVVVWQHLEVVRLDAAGDVQSRTRLLEFGSRVAGGVVASDGGLVLAGTTTPRLFGPADPLLPYDAGDESVDCGFVLKTNPSGTAVERSALLCGLRPEPGASTGVQGVARDAAGNLFVVGDTGAADFPVTPGAAKTTVEIAQGGRRREGFLASFNHQLTAVRFSTFLGADAPRPCSPGSACPSEWTSAAYSVAVNPLGQALVLAGTTGRIPDPTPGAFDGRGRAPTEPTPLLAPAPPQELFLMRYASDGSKVETRVPLGPGDPTDAVLVTTPDGGVTTVFSRLPSRASSAVAPLQLLRLNLTQSALLAEQRLETSARAFRRNDLRTCGGKVWLAGSFSGNVSRFAGVPVEDELGADVLLQLDGRSLRAEAQWKLPAGAAHHLGAVGNRSATLFSRSGARLQWPPPAAGQPAIAGIASAAGVAAQNTITPAEHLSLYGRNLAPEDAASIAAMGTPALPFAHAGVSVRVHGVLCPLLHVSGTQVNFIAPPQLPSGEVVTLEFTRQGMASLFVPLTVRASNPQVFREVNEQDYPLYATALNENGWRNSERRPARLASTVTVFVTGMGWPPAGLAPGSAEIVPGTVAKVRIPLSTESVKVAEGFSVDRWRVESVYIPAGAPASVVAVRFRIPDFPIRPVPFPPGVCVGLFESDREAVASCSARFTVHLPASLYAPPFWTAEGSDGEVDRGEIPGGMAAGHPGQLTNYPASGVGLAGLRGGLWERAGGLAAEVGIPRTEHSASIQLIASTASRSS